MKTNLDQLQPIAPLIRIQPITQRRQDNRHNPARRGRKERAPTRNTEQHKGKRIDLVV